MDKHTLGPWEANEWADGWEIGARDAHCTVCRLVNCNNAEANSNLIAAAPELLEALTIAVATIERLSIKHPPFNSSQGTLDVANAAIAKATGAPQP